MRHSKLPCTPLAGHSHCHRADWSHHLSFADTLMIGHHSTHELAAASFVNNMFNLAIIFSTGFSYGLTPIVGSLFGQNRCEEVGRTLKNSLAANTLLATIVCLVMAVLYWNIDNS